VTASILLIFLLLVVAATVGVYVLWPLLRRPAGSPEADAAGVALAVLRERRRELETSLAHLPADSPERRAALAEFAVQADAELPEGIEEAAAVASQGAARRPWMAAVLAVLLLVPPFGLYLLAGAPEAASPEFRTSREPASLDELVTDLRQTLHRDPKALDAWRMLGRAELARGRPDAARDAFEQALALSPAEAQARVDLADATAQAQGAVLEGRPIALIREALAIDPRNPKGLALAGAYEVTQRNPAAAIAHWKTLIEVLPAESEQALQVARFVADLEAGRQPRLAPGPAAAPAAAGSGGPAASAPSTQAAPGATGAVVAPYAGALRGRIDLERSIAAKLRPDDTLFIVARTVDSEGRPVGPPVAVMRGRGADLPLEFALDDRMAMSPTAKLSTVAPETRVVVIARLSRTGEATARSGDLQGASAPVMPGVSGLHILIDAVVE
jgi:cytochrome c-type biogenesis protein CcmH